MEPVPVLFPLPRKLLEIRSMPKLSAANSHLFRLLQHVCTSGTREMLVEVPFIHATFDCVNDDCWRSRRHSLSSRWVIRQGIRSGIFCSVGMMKLHLQVNMATRKRNVNCLLLSGKCFCLFNSARRKSNGPNCPKVVWRKPGCYFRPPLSVSRRIWEVEHSLRWSDDYSQTRSIESTAIIWSLFYHNPRVWVNEHLVQPKWHLLSRELRQGQKNGPLIYWGMRGTSNGIWGLWVGTGLCFYWLILAGRR